MAKDNEQVEKTQDDVTNPITQSILARNGVTVEKPTQDDKSKDGEGKVEDDTANPEIKEQEGQQEQNEVTLTEEDIQLLEDADIDEETLDGKSIEEIKELAQAQRKEAQVKDVKTQDQKYVVTEKDAVVGGFAQNLVGKTPQELLEIINEQNSYIGKLQAQPNKKEEAPDSLNQQLNINKDGQSAVSKQDAVDLLQLSPEEQMAHINAIIDKRVQEGVQQTLEALPEIKAVRQTVHNDAMNGFYGELSKSLPKDVATIDKAKEIFENWKNENQSKYSKRAFVALGDAPEALITLISNDYIIKNSLVPNGKQTDTKDVKNQEVKSEGKKKSYVAMRDMLKSSPKGKATFNFKRKASEDNESDLLSNTGDEGQQMMGRILSKYVS